MFENLHTLTTKGKVFASALFNGRKLLIAFMFALFMLAANESKAFTYYWISTTTGGVWTTAANWSQVSVGGAASATAPAAGSAVVIETTTSSAMSITSAPANTTAFTSLTTESTAAGTGTITIQGLSTGSLGAVTIGANTTLSYTGTVTATTLSISNSLVAANTLTLTISTGTILNASGAFSVPSVLGGTIAATITGTGTGQLMCGSMAVGSSILPTSSLYSTSLTSTIPTLTNNGAMTIQTSTNGANTSNTTFNLQSGAMTVTSTITINASGASNTATFTNASGAQTSTLTLNDVGTTWVKPGAGTTTITLNGTGTTVTYSGAGAQTVLATTYNNLTLAGSGTKTVTGTTVNGNFAIGGTVLNGASAITGTPTYGASAVLIYQGTAAQTTSTSEWPASSGPPNVTVNNGSGIVLGANDGLAGTLTMTSGNITTNANTLTLGTGTGVTGTLSYTAGVIIGNFARWIGSTGTNYQFPVGTAATYTNESVFANFTNLTAGLLTATFTASSPGSAVLSLSDGPWTVTAPYTDGYWTLTPSNSLASTNYSLSLTGTGFTHPSAPTNNTRILEETSVGGTYSLAGTQGNDNAPTIVRTGLTLTAATSQIYALGLAGSITLGNNYTIGTGPATFSSGGTELGSFASAMSDLNNNNMPASGSVTIAVSAGYTETIASTLQLTQSGTSSSNQIIFQKSGTGADPKITAYSNGTYTPATAGHDGIWALIGVKYVTINGIDLLDPATNTTAATQMEYGFGLFNASTTVGCQYDTIENCTVTLNKTNYQIGSIAANGYGPGALGSCGIQATDNLIGSELTEVVVASAAGAHSYNGFEGNTVTNCNTGISLRGYNGATNYNGVNNDIGGKAGNTVSNYGGGAPAAASSTNAFGIITYGQQGINIQNNTITTNNSSNVSSANMGCLYGIFNIDAVGGNINITNNTVTLAYTYGATTGGGTYDTVSAIYNGAAGTNASTVTNPSNVVNINNNTITNCTNANITALVCYWYGICNSSQPGTVNINQNVFSNNSTSATAGGNTFYCINHFFAGASYIGVTSIANINNNNIGMGSFTGATSTTLMAGVYIANGGGTVSTVNVNYDTLQGLSFTGSSSGSLYPIYNNTTVGTSNYEYNIFNNLTGLNSTATIAMIYHAGSGSNVTASHNRTANLSSPNTKPYVSTTPSRVAQIYGFYSTGAPSGGTANIQNNNFSNMTNTSTVNPACGIYIGSSSSAQTINIFQDTVSSLYNNQSTGGTVYGIEMAGGAAANIYQNRIYDLKTTGTTGYTYGIYIPASIHAGTYSIYNNLIGISDAFAITTAANTTVAVAGINIASTTASTTFDVYYNTVYLNATSSGTLFGTAAVYQAANATSTTGTLDLRNNILDNLSTPVGTGFSVALWRSAVALNNYATTSNYNIFYAGTPGSNNLIYYDGGTNSESAFTSYKSYMSSTGQDQGSYTENTPWLSTTPTSPYFLYENNSTAPYNPSIAYAHAQLLSAGAPYNVDYFGNTRAGSTGYLGNSTAPDIGAIEFCYVAPPTATSPQDFCITNPTVANLVATATGSDVISWYPTALSADTNSAAISISSSYVPTNLASSTALVNGSTYYGTQTYTNSTFVCQSQGSVPVVASIPSVALSSSISSQTNVLCYGATTGSYSVQAANGVSPYQYELGSGGYGSATTGAYNSGLVAAGSYTINIKDANGCTTSQPVTITQPASAVSTPVISETGALCNGGTGSVTVTTASTGGTGSITYSFNGGAYQSGLTFSPIAGGTSGTVIAQDANNCSSVASNSVTVTNPAIVSAPVINETDASCNGGNGSVTVTTPSTGGTGSITYSFNGGTYQSGLTFSPIAGGTTGTVVAQDANNCSSVASNSVTVGNPSSLTTPVINVTDPLCNGGDGTITVTTPSTGGTGTIQYALNGGTPQTSTTFNNVPPPTVCTVVASDANGCTSAASNSETVVQPTAITTPVITKTDAACNGQTGSVTVTTPSTGGTGTIQYSLNGGAPQTSTTFSGIAANTVCTVVASDANGCTSPSSNSVTVSQPAVLTAGATSGTPYAEGQTINLMGSASGGTTSYSYSWSGPLSYSSSAQDPSIAYASPGMSGAYTVTVTDANLCTATATTTVFVSNAGINIWIGNTTNWFTASNWTANAVPASCGDTIIIPTGRANYPVLTANAVAGSVTMQQGVNINQQTYSLSICGYLSGPTGYGTVATILGTGVTILNGTTAQTISGILSIPEMELSNTAGASFASGTKLSIANALDLKTGNLNVSSGTLTLTSSSVTQVAIIDNFSAGNSGTLTGIINSQRYYATSSTYNQHMMGSPVNSPPFSQFGAINYGNGGYVIPQSDCDEANMSAVSPYGQVFSYHENAPGAPTCGLAEWFVQKNGNATNGQGYSILKTGSGTLTLTGTANLNASYTLSGLSNSNWANISLQNRHMESGWQLVSNPYQATLQINTTNAGFDNQIQVWNANGPNAGTYQPATIGTDAIVAPFQAFMVHVTNPGVGNSYTINATDRVRTAAQFYAQHDQELDIVAQNVQTGLLDNTMVAFDSRATDGFDPQFDADKFGGALNRHTLYSLNSNKWMSRNVLNSINTTATIAVGFEPGATGSYVFSFNNVNTFDPTSYIYLEDLHLNTVYDIRSGNYTFTADSADEWNRFVLHFTPPAVIQTANATCSTTGMLSVVQPGAATWNYTVVDANNAQVASGVLNQSTPLSVKLGAGNYTLSLVDNNGYTVTKPITISGATDVTAGFEAPATVQAQSSVTFTNTSVNAANATWSISNGASFAGLNNPTYTFTQAGTYTVMLTVTSSTGCTATAQKTITVTEATAINNISGNGEITMWSYENRVYVDFSQLSDVNATIKIYDILGREISNDRFVSNSLYQKQIDNIDASYVIVSVKNDDAITTRKLFIVNTK